jgi:choline dehydrogenase-like flavoprotein
LTSSAARSDSAAIVSVGFTAPVVDPGLRTHDHPNLWLVGSGAFPTAGAVNPTLTIAALSLRAAEDVDAWL